MLKLNILITKKKVKIVIKYIYIYLKLINKFIIKKFS